MSTAESEKSEIVQLLLDAAERAQDAVTATLQEFDVPVSVAPAFRLMATSEEPVTPRDLAAALGRDPSTASLIADKLEQAGLIVRKPHPSDGRKRVLALTDRGKDLWGAMRDRLHATAILDRLTASERRSLRELLARMQP